MEKEKRVFKMATTESKGDKALKAEDFSEAFLSLC